MPDEREKTNPDYPVTPAWRPASHPGVRLPAPTLDPVRETPEHGTPQAAQPAPQTLQKPEPPLSPVRQPSQSLRPTSHSGYGVVAASQESIRPFVIGRQPASAPPEGVRLDVGPRPASQVMVPKDLQARPASSPAAPSIPAAPTPASRPSTPAPSAAHVPASQPTYRPASDGYLHPASAAYSPATPAAGLRPTSGFGLGVGLGGPEPGVASSRRAADPTRLLPWLRDKNKRFKALDDRTLTAMFSFASLHRVTAQTVVQPVDAAPTACFVVTEGSLAIRGRRPNGAVREIDRFGPADVVGLLALLDGKPSPYEIIALTNAELIAFEADKLAQHLAALHPTALLALQGWMPMIIDHLRNVQQRLARLAASRKGKVESRDDDAWRGGGGK